MADVEACELFVVGEIDDAAESVLHLVEGLTTETGHGEHERFDIGRQFREVDRDRFIVAIALAGEVIAAVTDRHVLAGRSEEHTSELQSLMRHSYAVFCLETNNRVLTH